MIHTRVTPPPLCTLTLTFKGTKDDSLHVIRAHGRGVAAQSTFRVSEADGSASVRVPRLCSASATLEVGVGGEKFEAEETELQLGGTSQMVWRQLGKLPSEVRVQCKLAPASEGGFVLTNLRVTPPNALRNASAAAAGDAVEMIASGDGVAEAAGPAGEDTMSEGAEKTRALIEKMQEEVAADKAAAAEKAAGNGAAEKAAVEEATAKEKVAAKEKAAQEEVAKEKAAKEKTAKEKVAAKEKMAKEEAAAKEKAAAGGSSGKAAADSLFAAGDVAGAADAYSALLSETGVENTGPLLSNRAACYLALRKHSACEADCDAALANPAELAPRLQVPMPSIKSDPIRSIN